MKKEVENGSDNSRRGLWLSNLSSVSWLLIVTFVFSLTIIVLNFLEITLVENLFLKPSNVFAGEKIWTLISYMFVHVGFFHLFVNLTLLFFLGGFVERVIGRNRFFWFYIISGVIAGLLSLVYVWFLGESSLGVIQGSNDLIIGASGAIFAIAGLFVVLLPGLKFTFVLLPILSARAYVMIPLTMVLTWAIFFYLGLPIGNVAQISGFGIGLIYGFYLKSKYKSKIQMLHKGFSDMETEDVAKFPSEDPSPVLRVSKDGTLLYSNETGDSLLKKWDSVVGSKVPRVWGDLVEEVLRTNIRRNVEVEHEGKVFSFTLVPIVGSGYVNLYGADVTDLKKAQKKISDRNVELISLASHEMGTPLVSITSIIDLIINGKMGKVTGKQKENLDIALHDAQRLNVLIKNMADAARIDEEKAVYQFSSFNINEVVKMAANTAMSRAREHGSKIIFDGKGSLLLEADKGRVEQVVLNLITNAVKYGKQEGGKIQIFVVKEKGNIVISVKDDGPGIPKGDLGNIFAKDFKVQKRAKRAIGNLGYGLYISSKIVEKHKGKIWVESKEGKGATFFISLPTKQSGENKIKEEDSHDEKKSVEEDFMEEDEGKDEGEGVKKVGGKNDVQRNF